MARKVSYRKQTVDAPNPIARFTHRQRHKFSIARVVADAPHGGAVLDYGCGDGAFLSALVEARPDLRLYGFDPESSPDGDGFTVVDTLDTLEPASVDVLCCYETLEHLYPDEIASFLADVERLVRPGGLVSVSVPVIGGPPLLLKELNRAVLFRRRSDYSLIELLAATFLGKPAPRPDDVRVTHKGFDFRALAEQLSSEMDVVETQVSPFPKLPWWLNSQAFSLFSPRALLSDRG